MRDYPPKVEADLRALEQALTLVDIKFNELSIVFERNEGELDPPEIRLGIDIATETSIPSLAYGYPEPEEKHYGVGSLRFEIATPEGKIVVEPTAIYAVENEHKDTLNYRSLTAYMNVHGIAELMPFAREALHGLAQKTFRTGSVDLPLYRSGTLEFPLPDEDFVAKVAENSDSKQSL